MTKDGLIAHLRTAAQELERVRDYCSMGEVVIVMTQDIYGELCTEQLDKYTTSFSYNTRNCGITYGASIICGPLAGHRVALINEKQEDAAIFPAILGMAYCQGIEFADVVVIDDDNHLFSLTSRSTLQFSDTGITVSFNMRTPAIREGSTYVCITPDRMTITALNDWREQTIYYHEPPGAVSVSNEFATKQDGDEMKKSSVGIQEREKEDAEN